MNTQTQPNTQTPARPGARLESLDPKLREWILEIAAHAQRLAHVIPQLKANDIDVSLSTLTRFVRQHREKILLAEGEDMLDTVTKLSQRGHGDAFHKATLEATRQRLYQHSLDATATPEATQKLHAQLLKEEAQIKKLEHDERKLLLAEQQARLQALRFQLLANETRPRQKAEEIIDTAEPQKQLPVPSDDKTQREDLLTEIEKILNRAGAAEEKLLEARSRLAENSNPQPQR